MINMSASHAVGLGFRLSWVTPKTIIKMLQTASLLGMQVLGSEFGCATHLWERPGSVWNCLWGHALLRSPGINCMSRVLYSGRGFISRATRNSMSKKHSNWIDLSIERPTLVFLFWLYVTFNIRGGIVMFPACSQCSTMLFSTHGYNNLHRYMYISKMEFTNMCVKTLIMNSSENKK